MLSVESAPPQRGAGGARAPRVQGGSLLEAKMWVRSSLRVAGQLARVHRRQVTPCPSCPCGLLRVALASSSLGRVDVSRTGLGLPVLLLSPPGLGWPDTAAGWVFDLLLCLSP